MMSNKHDRFMLIASLPGLTLLSQKIANILSLPVLDSDKILGLLIFCVIVSFPSFTLVSYSCHETYSYH